MILLGPIQQVIHRQYFTLALFATDYRNINQTDFKEELRQRVQDLEHVLLKSRKTGLLGNAIFNGQKTEKKMIQDPKNWKYRSHKSHSMGSCFSLHHAAPHTVWRCWKAHQDPLPSPLPHYENKLTKNLLISCLLLVSLGEPENKSGKNLYKHNREIPE